MQSARDERIPGKLICAIVAVGSLAFFGILTETVMNVLFPQLMGVLHISAATIQWLTTGYAATMTGAQIDYAIMAVAIVIVFVAISTPYVTGSRL